MAFQVRSNDGSSRTYSGTPSEELLASDTDIRDALDDVVPGSKHDRVGPAAGKQTARANAGTYPSHALTEASKAADLKWPPYEPTAAAAAGATEGADGGSSGGGE